MNEQHTLDISLESIFTQADKVWKYSPENRVPPSEMWRMAQEVRAKYQLPDSGSRWKNPKEYIEQMTSILKRAGIKLLYRHESGYLDQDLAMHNVGAIALGHSAIRDTTIVIDKPDETQDDEAYWFELRKAANQLAHESVHGFQDVRYPEMPDIEAEFEAYLYQSLNEASIKELVSHYEPKYLPEMLVSRCESIWKQVAASVRTNTKLNSEEIQPDVPKTAVQK